MAHPSSKLRIGAIVWAILLGGVVVVIGGSVLLPSTKRAHFDFQQQREAESSAAENAVPASQPAQP